MLWANWVLPTREAHLLSDIAVALIMWAYTLGFLYPLATQGFLSPGHSGVFGSVAHWLSSVFHGLCSVCWECGLMVMAATSQGPSTQVIGKGGVVSPSPPSSGVQGAVTRPLQVSCSNRHGLAMAVLIPDTNVLWPWDGLQVNRGRVHEPPEWLCILVICVELV